MRHAVLAAVAGFLFLAPALSSHTLVDPWETHYAEVARESLESGDWVRLRWQKEGFWSKPALTPWLIAGSLTIHGLASSGGYSGELVSTERVMWAVRLPFVLFGALGIAMIWWLVAQLASRRAAWLAALCLATTPFWFFVSRQAITDMPMAAAATGAIACFLLSVALPSRPIRRLFRRIDAHHLFFAVLGVVIVAQLAHTGPVLYWTRALGPGVEVPVPWLVGTAPFVLGWVVVYVTTRYLWPVRTAGQVTALWGYMLVGVAILAKGPPGLAVVGFTIALTIFVTGRWRWLVSARLIEGAVIVLLIAGPWHLAMLLCDGAPWANAYFGLHWFARAASGVHGDRGGFLYLAEQLATGMWPWIGLVPAALAATLARGRKPEARGPRPGRDVLRAAAAVWAVGGFAFFAIVETKFHHYILPVVPAFAILIALWIDEGARPRLASLVLGAGLVAGVALSLVGEHKQLIELFVYRHDRPWPQSESLRGELWAFGIVAVASIAALPWSRRWSIRALALCALVFAVWGMHRYMGVAAPHWGQRDLHEAYYRRRAIHSVTASDPPPPVLRVEVFRPTALTLGSSLPVQVAGGRRHHASVVVAWRTGVWLAVDGATGSRQPRSIELDADRLIAWQLFWRGENFWSGGEIYGDTPQARTAFKQPDNRELLDYLRAHGRVGRRYWVMTEAGRAAGLGRALPTPTARDTMRVEHDESNKFTLLSFVL